MGAAAKCANCCCSFLWLPLLLQQVPPARGRVSSAGQCFCCGAGWAAGEAWPPWCRRGHSVTRRPAGGQVWDRRASESVGSECDLAAWRQNAQRNRAAATPVTSALVAVERKAATLGQVVHSGVQHDSGSLLANVQVVHQRCTAQSTVQCIAVHGVTQTVCDADAASAVQVGQRISLPLASASFNPSGTVSLQQRHHHHHQAAHHQQFLLHQMLPRRRAMRNVREHQVQRARLLAAGRFDQEQQGGIPHRVHGSTRGCSKRAAARRMCVRLKPQTAGGLAAKPLGIEISGFPGRCSAPGVQLESQTRESRRPPQNCVNQARKVLERPLEALKVDAKLVEAG